MSDLLRRWNHLWITDGDCLRWIGSTKGGHGSMSPQVWHNRKYRRVCRMICEEAHGSPPTSKHQAAHDTPNGCIGSLCVNPDHLRWATQSENMMDRPIELRKQLSV